ncbi:MAG: outer-membrane lipoprotein carrier protein LolA [Bacteroidales bacterium]|nr:outer-membrane lipoprotein carrier protein LolA [Bacteroidales bacterium]
MKNLIICAAALLLSVCAFAAEPQEILSKIEKTNSTYTSVKGGFTQTKILATKARKTLKGDFYISGKDNLAMIYSEPATDRVIVSGAKLYLNRNAKPSQFDLTKSAAMASLANSLLYAVKGKVVDLASTNKADYTVMEDTKYYTINVTAKTQAARGYARITLKYRKSDCVLEVMEMEEFNHTVDVYQMDSITKNASIDASVFKF